jgi:hypothetical protein
MVVGEIGRPVTRLLQAGTLRLAKRSKKQAAFPLPAVLHENQLNQTNGAALTQQKRLLSP